MTDSEYNRRMKAAAQRWQRLAEAAASQFAHGKRHTRTYKSGPKAGRREQRLRQSLRPRIYTSAGEADGLALTFARHGVFRAYGVGRGTPAVLAGKTLRSPADWLSASLLQAQEEVALAAAEHQAGKVIRLLGWQN